MKKLVIILSTVWIFGSVHGQDFWRENIALHKDNEPNDTSTALSFVTLEGSLNYGTDGLSNTFLNTLWKGGYMDSVFIENSASQLLPVNRFGLQSTIGITYGYALNDTNGSVIRFSVLKRRNISGKFTDDAFRLGFQGNTQFKGEEAGIGGTQFTSLGWTQFRVGLATRESKNTSINVAFSALIGNQYNETRIFHGKLFTDSQGIFVDGEIAGDYYSSDTSNTSFFALNGFGTSVDIEWNYFTAKKGGIEFFKLEFLDFGFINWNKQTVHRYVDTTFHYTGIDISQYFSDPDFVASLPEDDNFIKSDTGITSRSTFLPAVIRASYIRTFNHGNTGARIMFAIPCWSNALPFGSIRIQHTIRRINTTISTGVAYGGYSSLQIPLDVSIACIKNTTIYLGTYNTLVFFNPDQFAGSGAFIKLGYCL